MGNYTGFRLSELKRFKPLAEQIKIYQNGDQTEREASRLSKELAKIKADPHNTYREWKNEVVQKLNNDQKSQNDQK